jgi:uncharacterized protein
MQAPLLKFAAALMAAMAAAALAREPLITHTFPTPGEIRAPDRTLANQSPVSQLVYSPEGRTLATLSPDGTIRIWDAQTGEKGTGELQRTVAPHTSTLAELGFKPDEKVVPAAWRPSSGLESATIVVASPTHIAAGFGDGTLEVWPVNATQPPRVLIGHHGALRALAFTVKGDQLASGGDDKVVNVWDVATGTLLCAQTDHAAPIVAIACNPNGQKMVSADANGTVDYWTMPLSPLADSDLAKIKVALPAKATARAKQPRRLLVFWRADAILHKGGVPAANHAIAWMGEKTGAYSTDFSRDYAALDPIVLARYDAIVLNSTAHLAIPDSAKQALLDFARKGGGVIGIHAAIDTFKPWPEGAAIIGATFGGHPWIPSGTWAVKVEAPEHPLNRAWGGKSFKMHDELYVMAAPFTRADRRVLLAMDLSDSATANPGKEKPEGERNDGDFAIAWIKRFGAGRVFYGGFGHLVEPFEDPAVLQFYLDGIQYALGDLVLGPKDDAPTDER